VGDTFTAQTLAAKITRTWTGEFMAADHEDRVCALYVQIGNNVREARKGSRLTQLDLANAVGMTRSSIANLEAGRQRIPVHLLVWIGEILGVSPRALLPDASAFDGMHVVPDVTEHLVNDEPGMRDFVQQTMAKVANNAKRKD
jgi:transcriptional regulator with XRE-family HTH domain